ncbi:hypothetical protein T4B_14129 [Trichinella pseudospiralis]|uniref:Uncharacterized protein n=2 Tax=Trichinella pseudospiralis TaxID=6337 RepID=A0A0V1FXF3_TRIPS|nr:hypothetical protein T4D_1438 [Trichinella pseudospiralis]KRZ28348.1 hypothetical protein T4B_14129 [Trichinella pseudospiralis]
MPSLSDHCCCGASNYISTKLVHNNQLTNRSTADNGHAERTKSVNLSGRLSINKCYAYGHEMDY